MSIVGGTPAPETKAYSERTYKRTVRLRRRNWSRKAATVSSVGLDVKYKRLRRVVAEPAHKAKWHNKRNGVGYVSTECCPPPRGHRGFPCKGER